MRNFPRIPPSDLPTPLHSANPRSSTPPSCSKLQSHSPPALLPPALLTALQSLECSNPSSSARGHNLKFSFSVRVCPHIYVSASRKMITQTKTTLKVPQSKKTNPICPYQHALTLTGSATMPTKFTSHTDSNYVNNKSCGE